MITNFDIFNHQDRPSLVLCNPNREELESLGVAYKITQTPRFNALSELSFIFPKSVDNNLTTLTAYDLLEEKRLIRFEGGEYYTIKSAQEDLDGKVFIKNVTCESQETELNSKRILSFGGTYKFYDPISPQNTLLGKIIEMVPSWSIGTIDPLLWNKYRTFSVDDSSVYAFLMNDVSSSYSCIFIFDTQLKTINAYTIATATTATDIFLSFDNLLKVAKFRKVEEEISTCLFCYGGKGLDIRAVNPLGGNAIYNFTYYKTTDWMTQDLIDAITAWEAKIALNQPIFADNLTQLKVKKALLVTQQTELVDLQGQYLALDGVRKARIEAGLAFADIVVQLNAKQAEINNKNVQISATQTQITNLETLLQGIVDDLDIQNTANFTVLQYNQLSVYIYENSFQNENLVQLDSMTPAEVQDASQELYDQAMEVLGRVAYPRYEFTCDAVNFLALKEYQLFINQMALGAVVTVQLSESVNIETVVLEININYDDPTDFSFTFSNRLRLDNEKFIFSDLLGQVVKTGSSVSMDKLKWLDWSEDYKDDVTLFINSALDTSKNELISASNQEIVINQNGLRGRTYIPATGAYKPTQVWLTSSVLAFSRDGFNTASLALGEVTVGSSKFFGLVADAVVGRMIAGNQLIISNQNNNFTLDANGATLYNANFSIVSGDNKKRIYLDPTNGISVQTNDTGTWKNAFYVDTLGNLQFAGNLSGASGTFSGTIQATTGILGGWTINNDGLYDTHGNYIYSNGNIKLGALTIAGSTATFSGNIYADKIFGEIVNNQIANGAVTDGKVSSGLNAGKVTTGTMSGDRVSGGIITWPGFSIGNTGTGFGVINASTEIDIRSLPASVNVMGWSDTIQLDATTININADYTRVLGDLQVNWGGYLTGYSTDLYIGPSYSNQKLIFRRGVLVGVSYI